MRFFTLVSWGRKHTQLGFESLKGSGLWGVRTISLSFTIGYKKRQVTPQALGKTATFVHLYG